MITRVWSDLPHFREVEFTSGMNVIVADQSEDSSETESTNGLGKTTLIRIIQFCLGADLSKDKVLNHPDLRSVLFGIDLLFDDETVSISRSTESDGKSVSVTQKFLVGFDVEVTEVSGDAALISIDDWRALLTAQLLGRRQDITRLSDTGSPSFREIAYYYMRLGKAAFIDPKQVFQGQSGPSMRLNVSYLLGLNWASQKALQTKRDHVGDINKAIKVLRDAEAGDVESLGDLEASRVVLEDKIVERTGEVENFNVRQDYGELEERLTSIDRELHSLINENHSDRRLLENYQLSAKETPDADSDRPVSILRDAGAVFKPEALKAIEQVSSFHDQVYRNRKAFLDEEIALLKVQIKARNNDVSELTAQKSEVLRLLASSGALDSLIQLQRSLTDMTAELEALKSKIDERKKFDRQKDEVALEITSIRTVLRNDLEDRREAIDEAVGLFAKYTNRLYGKPAKLAIDVKTAGYGFNITIERDGSEGVEQMVVFCFDLMVATLRARRKSPFNTLIHDSSLFADVDSRQYGLALQLAFEEASAEGFQYVCCLNAGTLPKDHLGDLALNELVRLKLTDDSDKTRLLGKRLSAREKS